ncbi:hypothetical protein SAMN05661008_00814 [Alkalithermobacter thermoalcaliphilus JW-YL-7 = DSM 7308]|uniref:Uncharacterized protein n=1 Tax=Alkalithermobacter thermoalcaliphilus JW-YL-7 = DSM 7308 TaxID=1121328 RepID=A0A150FQS1_CLOPD|nr:hypothetical protein JWYL7_1038 [[Clostridium] paradoxum JW-YL-7 = DSM 7308]SHK75431.1 hypothetical protein SAMN05661008_00814 [[Clostridium] paradoxum JW-YL-7 = DSM 7308]
MPEINYFKNKSVKVVKTNGNNSYIDKETSADFYDVNFHDLKSLKKNNKTKNNKGV